MYRLQDRAFSALNLQQYGHLNTYKRVRYIDMFPPEERQYILRMAIKRPFGTYLIPEEYHWALPVINTAIKSQREMAIRQPYVYLTIRHGLVDSVTDDEWHVDGFSMGITHLPEQNYIWCDHTPTEVITKPIRFPIDFNPLKHNIHWFFQDKINDKDIVNTLEPKTLYGLDPYVIHRRPSITAGAVRTFVRVSFTPIEIADDNNTPNPLLPVPKYNRDGIKNFRNNLIQYDRCDTES